MWEGWAIYRAESPSGELLWYEVRAKDDSGIIASMVDFMDGDFLGLTPADKARAMKRVVKRR